MHMDKGVSGSISDKFAVCTKCRINLRSFPTNDKCAWEVGAKGGRGKSRGNRGSRDTVLSCVHGARIVW